MDYAKPEVVDYGTVEELTAAVQDLGTEDADSKLNHATSPTA